MEDGDFDQRLRDLQREYLEFLDDEEDQGIYMERVKQMISDKSQRLTVNVNDLRRKNPGRAKNLLESAFEEQIAFQKALKEYVSSIDPTYAKVQEEFFVAFSGSFGNKHVTPRSLTSRKPSSGRIYVNGRIRNEKKFRRRSCYILQDDKVQDQLSIEEIITALKMQEVRHTRAGNLSGGQKKRLAIGLELISDPPVMFLDEPTSGLDCSMSKQMVRLLHELARQGRTVVVTIHQPSATLLQKVDRLYAMVGGKCAFMGSVPLLRPYLEQMHWTCPPYHNPVDFCK
ncbi:Minichromosome maintenance 3 [Operophtera brumata]|uniref:DNA helicase n=1 Tax=Operophtera brumata TaxID=104452 RepID=A0A0L7KVA6_OPEBR|nr:Minichromosome maintenance 3 [Operophtera brumata]